MDVAPHEKVVFTHNKIPYYGVVQRVTGNMVAIRATGLLHPNISVVAPVRPGTMHIVHKDGVVKV